MIAFAMMLAMQDVVPLNDYMSGTMLLAHCEKRDVTCTAYVEGAVDLRRSLDAYHITKATFCPVGKIGSARLADITVRWLRAHPQSQHMGAGALVIAAVSELYPCRKT